MTMKIVIYDPVGFDDTQIASIRSAAGAASVMVSSPEQLRADLEEAEIFFGFHAPEVFFEASQLRWIQTTSAGLDKILVPELVKRDLMITNASGVYAPQVVEQAWCLTLAVAGRVPLYWEQQKQHHWQIIDRIDLDGSTVGIIGLGGIGRRYARVAAAFGMRVLAVDLHQPPKPESVESLWPIDQIDELLEQSDFVLVSCPYTSETHHLVDGGRLSRMKSSAVLVNIARGSIVDEAALVSALENGHIAAAGIDVCEQEPLPPESSLWNVPNLVITPHCAGLSPQRMKQMADFFIANLQRYLDGQPLANLVNQQLGYPVPAQQ